MESKIFIGIILLCVSLFIFRWAYNISKTEGLNNYIGWISVLVVLSGFMVIVSLAQFFPTEDHVLYYFGAIGILVLAWWMFSLYDKKIKA